MKRMDYHMHTYFSADSEENPEQHVLQAIHKGLEEICFTDHQDFDYPGMAFDLDIEPYYQEIQALKEKYRDQIQIKWGIEIGLDRNYKKEIDTVITSYPFDFVIGSIHVINRTEFYNPASFFTNKTKTEAHHAFFKETLACVKEFDNFNVLGHLDYIVRYGPYKDKRIDYDKHTDMIDEILKTLITKKIGLEVNTSGYTIHKNCGFPNYDIIKRYYALGGRIITIGTDAHVSERVGAHVDTVMKEYQKIGFNEISTFTNRKLEEHR
jgi:histidinol-phosphatase (PHP family)